MIFVAHLSLVFNVFLLSNIDTARVKFRPLKLTHIIPENNFNPFKVYFTSYNLLNVYLQVPLNHEPYTTTTTETPTYVTFKLIVNIVTHCTEELLVVWIFYELLTPVSISPWS